MASRSRLFSKIAKDVGSDGNLSAAALSPDVSFGATVYDSTGVLPYVGNDTGDQAYVKSTNRFYIWDSAGWYNVALINKAPNIASVLDSDGGTSPFSLATDGTATTITITATDSDGDPITYSATGDGNFSGLATLSQDGNVFTITPLSQDSATTTSSLVTFKATDGVNISSTLSTFTLYFLSPYWDEAVLSVGTSSTNSLDNSTFIDRSTNAHTITTYGTSGAPTQNAFHPYLDNWSNYFNDHRLDIANHTGFDFSSSADFTVEMWVNRTGTSGQYAGWLVGKRATGSPYTFSWYALIDSSNKFVFADNATGVSSTTTIETNRWYHVAATMSSGTLRIFVNGTLEATSTGINISEVNAPLTIANYSVDTPQYVGYISNLRIVKGTALYTSTFVPPTSKLTAVSGTSLLTCQSNRFIDNSSNGHSITVAGTPEVSAFNPFGQESEYDPTNNIGSGYFVRANSQRIAGPNAILPGGGGGTGSDFTLEGWIYPNNVSGNHTVTAQATGATGDNGRSSITFVHSGQYIGTGIGESFGMNSNGVATFDYYAWNHFVWQRDGSTYSLYLNGERVAQATNTNKAIDGGQFRIGTLWDGDGTGLNPADGWISDVRVTYSAVYDGGTSITVPTTAVGGSSAEFYVPFDNAGIYDKTGRNTLTLSGNTTTSTTQTKYATTSIAFDGTGDIISIPNPNLDNSNWTIEMWAYQNSAADGTLFSQGGSNVSKLSVGSNGSFTFQIFRGGNQVLSQPAAGFQSGQWNHVALVCDGSYFRIYLNGTSVASVATNASYPWNQGYTDTTLFKFGVNDYYAGEYWNGYMEDIQMLKGVAKYGATTATNFTPPTQTQGRTYQQSGS